MYLRIINYYNRTRHTTYLHISSAAVRWSVYGIGAESTENSVFVAQSMTSFKFDRLKEKPFVKRLAFCVCVTERIEKNTQFQKRQR